MLIRGSLVLALLSLSVTAHAQEDALGVARDLFAAAQFEEAVGAFDALLAAPDPPAETVVEAHRYLAALHTMLDDAARARPHLEALFALDADAQPPGGAPPNVEAAFAVARARVATPDPATDGSLEPVGPDEESGSGDAIVLGLVVALGALLIGGGVVLALVLTNESSNVVSFEGVTVVGW